MILDIEGKEINVGDECYIPWSNTIARIKIVKETNKTIYYKWKRVEDADWFKYKTSSRKSSNPAKNLIKIC